MTEAYRGPPVRAFADAAALETWLPAAAAFFATLTGANRYAVLYRITTVKRPETRARSIEKFVAMLTRGETVYPTASK